MIVIQYKTLVNITFFVLIVVDLLCEYYSIILVLLITIDQ